MAGVSPSLFVIILNANRLNSIKRQDWNNGYNYAPMYSLQEIQFRLNDTNKLKVNG